MSVEPARPVTPPEAVPPEPAPAPPPTLTVVPEHAPPAAVPAPWYARRGPLIGAALVGVVALVLAALGIMSFRSASSTRDEAKALDARAQGVLDEAAATRDEAAATLAQAEALPGFSADLQDQMDAVLTAADDSTAAYVAWSSCFLATTTVDQALPCFDLLDEFEQTVTAETAAVDELGNSVTDAQEAVDNAQG